MSRRCNMLWIGPRLGAVERACILSVLRQRHPLTLWVYDRPDGIPEGVELADAREILPAESIIRHHSGSVSLFSNWFRYRLQALGRGIWLDSDLYLLRPIEAGAGATILPGLAGGVVGTAPLLLPPDSPLLPPLLALFDQRTVPPWAPLRARLAARWRLIRTGRVDLSLMPWGTAGPRAVTGLVRRFGLQDQVSPPDVFHPYDWREADWVRDPTLSLAARTTERTVGVHLWNERIKSYKETPAPPGSFLARLQQEGA